MLSTLGRFAIYLAATLVSLLVILFLVLIFYISPKLNEWREPIQQFIYEETGMPVEFGHLQLEWQGLLPQLLVHDVTYQERELEASAEHLPRAAVGELAITLRPNVLSAFFTKSGYLDVQLRNARLPIYIDPAGDVWLGRHRLPIEGVSFSSLGEEHESDAASLAATVSNVLSHNLHEQIVQLETNAIYSSLRQVNVDNVLLAIRDASSGHTQQSHIDFELSLNQATVERLKQGLTLDLRLHSEHLSPHEVLVIGDLNYDEYDSRGQPLVQGQVSLKAESLQPRQLFLSAFEDLGVEALEIESFELAATIDEGLWHHLEADLSLTGFAMTEAEFERLDLHLEGEVSDVLAVFLDRNHAVYPLAFEATLSQGWLHETVNFRHDFALERVMLKGHYSLDDAGLSVLSFSEFEVDDPNVKLVGSGKWHAVPNSSSGYLAISGILSHLNATYLPRFLPNALDTETLNWLNGAFERGTLYDGQFLVDGLLDHYPFGLKPEAGTNRIRANFRDFALDFHHQATGTKWPVLEMSSGEFRFNNDQILIDANRGWMNNEAGERSISYDNLQAVISSLERNAMLEIKTNAETSAADFLVLMKQTPLSALLGYVLDEAEAEGDLRAALTIEIPLNNLDAATIDGKIYTQEASFRLNPNFPQATELSGELSFNERYLRIEQAQAQLLGGTAVVHGDVSNPGEKLFIKGELSGQGIYDFYPLAGLRQLQGKTPYEFTMLFKSGGDFDASLTSHLEGMAINYDGLYQKAAQRRVPIVLQWQRRGGEQRIAQDRITANYDNDAAQLDLVLAANEQNYLAFQRGALAFGEQPRLPERGLFIHGGVQQLSVDALLAWIDRFGFESSESSPSLVSGFDVEAQQLELGGVELPQIRAQSHLTNFDNINLQLSGPTVKGALSLQSQPQAAGAYDVQADFEYLNWRTDRRLSDNSKSSEKRELSPVSSLVDARWTINRLDARVGALAAYDYQLRAVDLAGQAEDKMLWRIHKLSHEEEGATLQGTGYLRNQEERVKAELEFNIDAQSIDSLANTLKLGDELLDGQGTIQGTLLIHDFMNIEPKHLELNVFGELKDGYINKAGTGGTRMLALLSIQALSKLPEFKTIFSSKGDNALQYNYLRFHAGLKDARLWLPDFRLESPLLALVAQGNANLTTDAIDLDVVAVPRLDMSGAAVLTGVLVNPAVGVAAFLSQWVLRSPMEASLTQRFKVGGTLDAITVDGKLIDSAQLDSIIKVIEVDASQHNDELDSIKVEESEAIKIEPLRIIEVDEAAQDRMHEVLPVENEETVDGERQLKTPTPIILE